SMRAQDEGDAAERLARQRMRARVGIFGDLALNIHSSNFIGAPEAPTCITLDQKSYSGGTSTGFDAGLLFELPLTPRWYFMARAGYYATGATQKVQAYIGPINLLQDASKQDTASGISEYSFTSTLGMLGGDLSIGFRPFDFPLTIRVGPEIGGFITKT